MPKMRKMAMPKMTAAAHYQPPRSIAPGGYNRPRKGRVGKSMPSIKQFRPLRAKR